MLKSKSIQSINVLTPFIGLGLDVCMIVAITIISILLGSLYNSGFAFHGDNFVDSYLIKFPIIIRKLIWYTVIPIRIILFLTIYKKEKGIFLNVFIFNISLQFYMIVFIDVIFFVSYAYF